VNNVRGVQGRIRDRAHRTARLGLTAVAAAVLACGGGEAPQAAAPQRTSVTFEYVAATSTDPSVAERFGSCVQGVGATHIHPSWRGFERFDMTAAGDRWTITFPDAPVGSRERIRVSDPNACAENATGASTRSVFANGVPLTDVVDTPGSGIEPGLAFTLSDDGTVAP
jgi:hypothetical protein